jgi:hypothetical protein
VNAAAAKNVQSFAQISVSSDQLKESKLVSETVLAYSCRPAVIARHEAIFLCSVSRRKEDRRAALAMTRTIMTLRRYLGKVSQHSLSFALSLRAGAQRVVLKMFDSSKKSHKKDNFYPCDIRKFKYSKGLK